jgi:hypothetical protein
MIQKGENRNLVRKTRSSTTLYIINPTWASLGSKSDVRCESQGTNSMRHAMASEVRSNKHSILLHAKLRRVSTARSSSPSGQNASC